MSAAVTQARRMQARILRDLVAVVEQVSEVLDAGREPLADEVANACAACEVLRQQLKCLRRD